MLKSLASITPPPPHKIRYSLLLFMLLLVAVAGLAASLNPAQAQSANGKYDTDGDGLIEINNLEQLYAIRFDTDGNGRSNSNYYATAYPVASNEVVCRSCIGYELARPLDFNTADSYSSGEVNEDWTTDEGWTPIRGFSATFDGNGHTISNLYVDLTGQVSQGNAGLFGWTTSSAVIRGIGLLNADVNGVSNVGGLVGWNKGGQISHSYVTGAVSGTGGNIGGLVGDNRGAISRSYSTADVTGGGSVGGLVGYNNGTITDSYATGAITGGGNVGGLVGVGYNNGTITDSYATGAVTGDYNVGGLAAVNLATISRSYATGPVTGNYNVGGLAGGSYSVSNDSSRRAFIRASYATGSVTGTSRVGGLVGRAGFCYNSKTSTCPSSFWNYYNNLYYSTITNSYAIGRVSGTGGYIGGLLGYGRGGNYTAIARSYWNTDVTATGVGGGGVTGAGGNTTAQLQAPTGRTGIYARWSDGNWDFGSSSQYPALKADMDGDGTATAAEFGPQGRTATTPTLPGAPTISSVTPGVGSLTVAWSAPSSNADVTEYDLRHILTSADETVDANWTVTQDVWTGSGALQYTLTGLTGGVQYDVQARAGNPDGYGAWSATVTGTPQSAGTPGTSDASRAFSQAVVAPSGQLTVTISGAGTGAAQVVETLPTGFSYVSHSPSDIAVATSGQAVTFTLLGNDSFTYTVTASDTQGSYDFTGVLTPLGGAGATIGGASTVTVSSVPLVTLSLTGSPRMTAVQVTATFTTAVTGFELSDVAVEKGTASNFATVTEGTVYTFDVTPSEVAAVTVNIAANAATDSGGNGNAAATLSFTPYDDDGNGKISKAEALVAITDYFGQKLTKAQAVAVIALYFASRS